MLLKVKWSFSELLTERLPEIFMIGLKCWSVHSRAVCFAFLHSWINFLSWDILKLLWHQYLKHLTSFFILNRMAILQLWLFLLVMQSTISAMNFVFVAITGREKRTLLRALRSLRPGLHVGIRTIFSYCGSCSGYKMWSGQTGVVHVSWWAPEQSCGESLSIWHSSFVPATSQGHLYSRLPSSGILRCCSTLLQKSVTDSSRHLQEH